MQNSYVVKAIFSPYEYNLTLHIQCEEYIRTRDGIKESASKSSSQPSINFIHLIIILQEYSKKINTDR